MTSGLPREGVSYASLRVHLSRLPQRLLENSFSAGPQAGQTHLSTLWQQRHRTSSGIARSGNEGDCLTRSLQAEKRQMADSKLNVVCVDCPYCDGENIIARVRSNRSDLDFTDREIACKHCQSVFSYRRASRGFAGHPKKISMRLNRQVRSSHTNRS